MFLFFDVFLTKLNFLLIFCVFSSFVAILLFKASGRISERRTHNLSILQNGTTEHDRSSLDNLLREIRPLSNQRELCYNKSRSVVLFGSDIVEVNNNWRFCAVGNIKAQRADETGKILYGTKAFSGGTKVYIDDNTWRPNEGDISVIGLNRFGRYAVERVPVDSLEHIRVQRIFKPKVIEIMDYLEVMDGWAWRGKTAGDRKALRAFVNKWNNP